MKDKIKELRLRIDGLSQLVKELKPFTWIHGINKEAENTDADIYQMYLVSDSLSFSNTNHKYHTVIKTDRGVYRTSSTTPFDESLFKTFDRNSKEINKAFDSLILAKAWLGEILEELKEEVENDFSFLKDVVHELGTDWHQRTHVEKVIWLRQEITNLIKNSDDFSNDKFILDKFSKVEEEIAIKDKLGTLLPNEEQELWDSIPNITLEQGFVYKYLCEATIWLQFELNRIKENG